MWYFNIEDKKCWFQQRVYLLAGDYVEATDDRNPKNNNLPQSIDAIYLCSVESLQGGHEMMDLATGRMFTRQKVDACAMTRMIVDRVELLAEKQGY